MGKPKSLTKADVPVVVKIDAKLRARWAAAKAKLDAATQKGASAFDLRYETIEEILDSDPPLYLGGGFSTDKAFLASIGETPRDARRNVQVAHFASPAEEARYGATKLDAALALLRARVGGKPLARLPVAFEKLHIPTKDGPKSLDEASVDELRTATRALDKKGKTDVGAQAAAVTKVLRSPGLKDIRVRFAGGHFTLTNITADAIAELGRALATVRVPKPAPAKKPVKTKKGR